VWTLQKSYLVGFDVFLELVGLADLDLFGVGVVVLNTPKQFQETLLNGQKLSGGRSLD